MLLQPVTTLYFIELNLYLVPRETKEIINLVCVY